MPRKSPTKTEEPTLDDEDMDDTAFTEDDLHAVSEPVEDDDDLANWPTARPLPPGVIERPDNEVEVVDASDLLAQQIELANPNDPRSEITIDPAFLAPSPNPQTPEDVATMDVNLTNDVPTGRGPEPPRQPIDLGDSVLIYDERIQKYYKVAYEQAQYMPRDGYGVPIKERHSPNDEAEHGSPERAVHFQEPGELASNALEQAPVERPDFSKKARLAAIKKERDLLEGQRSLTTDIVVLSRVQERLNLLAGEEAALKYAPEQVDGPRAFGHARSRGFSTPIPGVNEQITFQNYIHVTEAPMEIAALTRLIERGDEGDELVELEPGQRPYFHRDGSFLGWEKDNSPNVKNWLKQRMLREW